MRSTIPDEGIQTGDDCVKWLDSVLMVRPDKFNYSVAVNHIKSMRARGKIDSREYLELFEACAHRRTDGHYRNSYIYQSIVGRILW